MLVHPAGWSVWPFSSKHSNICQEYIDITSFTVTQSMRFNYTGQHFGKLQYA